MGKVIKKNVKPNLCDSKRSTIVQSAKEQVCSTSTQGEPNSISLSLCVHVSHLKEGIDKLDGPFPAAGLTLQRQCEPCGFALWIGRLQQMIRSSTACHCMNKKSTER